uniref:Ephrin RBD domain-containing protein n=1 Tax=Heterorhabditis bacteriophora TaxID=37862 RepID=A0A1I7XCY0_HETBA
MTQSIVLRPFSPIPGGPVYHPNKTYYFTSFSSGNEYGIDQHADGLCAQGMRLVVEIKSTSDSLFLGPLSTTSTTEIPQVPIERVPYSGLVAQPEARTSEMLSERKDRTIESTPYNQYNSDVLSPLRSPATYGYVELPHMFQGEPDEKSHKMLNSGLGHGVQERARIHVIFLSFF